LNKDYAPFDFTSYELCIQNYKILKSLNGGDRLVYDSETKALQKEERWLQSLRRKINFDSRNDILQPIKETIGNIRKYTYIPEEDVAKCLDGLKENFEIIYPDFTELHEMLSKM
jgi:hypothetical protein